MPSTLWAHARQSLNYCVGASHFFFGFLWGKVVLSSAKYLLRKTTVNFKKAKKCRKEERIRISGCALSAWDHCITPITGTGAWPSNCVLDFSMSSYGNSCCISTSPHKEDAAFQITHSGGSAEVFSLKVTPWGTETPCLTLPIRKLMTVFPDMD